MEKLSTRFLHIVNMFIICYKIMPKWFLLFMCSEYSCLPTGESTGYGNVFEFYWGNGYFFLHNFPYIFSEVCLSLCSLNIGKNELFRS